MNNNSGLLDILQRTSSMVILSTHDVFNIWRYTHISNACNFLSTASDKVQVSTSYRNADYSYSDQLALWVKKLSHNNRASILSDKMLIRLVQFYILSLSSGSSFDLLNNPDIWKKILFQ